MTNTPWSFGWQYTLCPEPKVWDRHAPMRWAYPGWSVPKTRSVGRRPRTRGKSSTACGSAVVSALVRGEAREGLAEGGAQFRDVSDRRCPKQRTPTRLGRRGVRPRASLEQPQATVAFCPRRSASPSITPPIGLTPLHLGRQFARRGMLDRPARGRQHAYRGPER